MAQAPKWFLPVVIIALLWNLMGCAAYLSDAMLSAADIAKMSDAEKAMTAARPLWAVGKTCPLNGYQESTTDSRSGSTTYPSGYLTTMTAPQRAISFSKPEGCCPSTWISC